MPEPTATVVESAWNERAAKMLGAGAHYNDPVAWLDRFIDWGRDSMAPYQRETIGDIPRRKRVAVRGPHGLGKSAEAAWAVLWFSITRELAGTDWKVLTTASAWRHLTIYLWPEIHKWLNRVRWDDLGMSFPRRRSELLDLRMKLNHGAASAIASDDPVNLEGAHADSILYIFDEAKAIPPDTWDAAEGAMAGGGQGDDTPLEAFALAISTPGPPQGRFYDIHARKPGFEDWHTRHVTLQEAVAAGRISLNWAEQRERQWGADSALYHNRVLGQFRAADEDAVIPLSWAEAAVERWRAWSDAGSRPDAGPHWLSADVARSGQDQTAIAIRRGFTVEQVTRHRFADTMLTTSKVTGMLTAGQRAIIDAIGVGAGVFDRMRELDLPVTAYTGSAKTYARDRASQYGFTNTRSAAWWHVRELLDPAFGSILALPDDDQLLADLSAPHWAERSGDPPRIQVEPKEDLVRRLGRSTDTGDAVAMVLWADRLHGVVEVAEPRRPGDDADATPRR
ncbi:MAG: hypothetical protein ACRDHF_12670, partial [Tepidiformaceae bacterium]